MLDSPALTTLLSSKRLFITGTNTGIGKTTIACELLRYLNLQGKKTAAFKPVASGSEHTSHGLRNKDALQLQEAASLLLPYDTVNPFVFEPPIAPHIAATQANVSLSVEKLVNAFKKMDAYHPDITLIEGAGGWLVPLNKTETLANFAKAIQAEVIVIVGMTLGCLNHAFLTEKVIRAMGIPIKGWIANQIDPDMLVFEDNKKALQETLEAPYLGTLDFIPMSV